MPPDLGSPAAATAEVDGGVRVANLSVRYPRTPTPALRDVTIDLAQHEVGLILGPSGSGKSTLGLALNGVVPRLIHANVTGSISVGGSVIDQNDPANRGLVGSVFQDPESQFCTLAVRDEVAFGPENLRVRPGEIDDRINRCLDAVGLGGFGQRNVYRLSGGQKQRLAVACVLALEPKAFFFDSPTANLDPEGAFQLYQTIRGLKGTFPIFLVEQRLDDLIDAVDRIVLLRSDGTVHAIEHPARLFEPHRREELERTGVWIPEVVEMYWRLPPRIRPKAPPLSIAAAAAMIRPYYRARPTRPSNGAPASSKLAVRIEAYSFRYPDGTPALDRASIAVPEGAFHALLGQNGSGKTTLVHHLVGIHRPPRGAIFLFGQDVATMPLASITSRVGFVFQNPEHQFVAPTVRDEIAYGLVRQSRRREEIDQVVDDLIDRFDLRSVASANPFTLSAGQMRRLSVATVLAVGPELLVLDEPTFGQDRASAQGIMHILAELNRNGKTILIVTHDMRLVGDYAKSASVMSRGRAIFHGSPDELFREETMLAETSLKPPPIWRLSALVSPDDNSDRVLRLPDLMERIVA